MECDPHRIHKGMYPSISLKGTTTQSSYVKPCQPWGLLPSKPCSLMSGLSRQWQLAGAQRYLQGDCEKGQRNWKEQVRECIDDRGEGRTERRCPETEISFYSAELQ